MDLRSKIIATLSGDQAVRQRAELELKAVSPPNETVRGFLIPQRLKITLDSSTLCSTWFSRMPPSKEPSTSRTAS